MMGGSEFTLSVVDQSPMRSGGFADDALRESVKLAQVAERLGYSRYWVAEHHNATSYACTSPELLIAQIAGNTETIRVGSGGVMLLNYSALRVAEQFRVLHAFHSGRIDLGIGRASGADPLASEALVHPRPRLDPNGFPAQLSDLLDYLEGTLDPAHRFAEVKAQPGPAPDSGPEVWLLGSGTSSAELAAELGLPYAFADFLGNAREVGPSAAESYRRNFKASRRLAEPKLSVAFDVICAPTEEEARLLARSRDFNRVAEVYGVEGLLPPEEVDEYTMTDEVRRFMEEWSKCSIDGDPRQVRERLLAVAELYGTKDIGLVTNCYAFEDRARSYELLAEVFGL